MLAWICWMDSNSGSYHLSLQIFHAVSVGYRMIFHFMFKSDFNSYFIHLNNSCISHSVVGGRMLSSIYLDPLQWKLLPSLVGLQWWINPCWREQTSKTGEYFIVKPTVGLRVPYSIYQQLMTEIYSNSNSILSVYFLKWLFVLMLTLQNYISLHQKQAQFLQQWPNSILDACSLTVTPTGLTLSWLVKFPHFPSKLFSSLIFQLLKLFCHPLLKTAFILFLPLFTTLRIISSAMCNVDSWDLMSSCLAYVTHSNKLFWWIMYHMYTSQVLPALWRFISALIVYHLNRDFVM